MSIHAGEYTPKITVLATRLDHARAHLAALPRPSVIESAVAALPWETQTETVETLARAEADVAQLQQLIAVAERSTLQHVLDLLECIPRDRENFLILAEALIYTRALAKAKESQV